MKSLVAINTAGVHKPNGILYMSERYKVLIFLFYVLNYSRFNDVLWDPGHV